MKKILSAVIGCFIAVSSFAQYYNTVTIKVNGNKNRQIVLDGRTYSVDNTSTNKNVITITDLQPGQHTIEVLRNNTRKTNPVTTTFTLPQGYDLNITINGSGSVQVKQKRSANANTAITHPAMSDADFNNLLSSVQKKWFNSSKVSTVSDAFANTGNYFTSSQVSQLLQSVNGEANRLQLAKASYSRVVDVANFNTIYSLLNDQASKDDLSAYISANYNNNVASTYHTPMSSAAFDRLLQDVQNQWQAGAKLNMISNAFNGTNYFTSAQARQLVQQVDAEGSRLQLAKQVYRNITDAGNFNIVYELLGSQSAKNELAAYIRQYGGDVATSYSETYRAPMNDADFQLIVDNVRRQWLPGAKMTAVSDAIANTSNYFSTVQLRQLLGYVSAENNRLQLLKSAYAHTTDRSNYTSLYDLLGSQTSRDELTRYINGYTGY